MTTIPQYPNNYTGRHQLPRTTKSNNGIEEITPNSTRKLYDETSYRLLSSLSLSSLTTDISRTPKKRYTNTTLPWSLVSVVVVLTMIVNLGSLPSCIVVASTTTTSSSLSQSSLSTTTMTQRTNRFVSQRQQQQQQSRRHPRIAKGTSTTSRLLTTASRKVSTATTTTATTTNTIGDIERILQGNPVGGGTTNKKDNKNTITPPVDVSSAPSAIPLGGDNRTPPALAPSVIGDDIIITDVPSPILQSSLEPSIRDINAPRPSPSPTVFPTTEDDDSTTPSSSSSSSSSSGNYKILPLANIEIQAAVNNGDPSQNDQIITQLRYTFQDYLENEMLFTNLQSVDLTVLNQVISTNDDNNKSGPSSSSTSSASSSTTNPVKSNRASSSTDNTESVANRGYDTKSNDSSMSLSPSGNNRRAVLLRVRVLLETNNTTTTTNTTNTTDDHWSTNKHEFKVAPTSYYRIVFAGNATFEGKIVPTDDVLRDEQKYILIDFTERLPGYITSRFPDQTVDIAQISLIDPTTNKTTVTNTVGAASSPNNDDNNGTLLSNMSEQTIILVAVGSVALLFIVVALFVIRHKQYQHQRKKKQEAKKEKRKSSKAAAAASAAAGKDGLTFGAALEATEVDYDTVPDVTKNATQSTMNSPASTNGAGIHQTPTHSSSKHNNKYNGDDNDDDDDDDDSHHNTYGVMYSSPYNTNTNNTSYSYYGGGDDNSMSDIISITDGGGSILSAPTPSRKGGNGNSSSNSSSIIGIPDAPAISSTPTPSKHERMLFE